MIAGRSSIQVETKKGLEEDRSEIGWKTTGSGMGTGTMIGRIAREKGESGEGGAPTGTGTETWTRGIDALAATGTGREIREIESRAERRKRTEGRRSPRGQTGQVGTRPSSLPLAKRALSILNPNWLRGSLSPQVSSLPKSFLLLLPRPWTPRRILAQQQKRLVERLEFALHARDPSGA